MPSGDGAIRVMPDPAIVDARPAGLSHFAIGSDGVTVVVYYYGGEEACFGLQKVDVTLDDAGTPTITVFEGTRPEAVGQACDMIAVLKSTVVTLTTPVVGDFARGGVPPGEPELPANPTLVEPQAGVLDPIAVAVSGYTLSADGLTLIAQFWGGVTECYGIAQASVTTVDRPLSVVITEGRLPGTEVCIEIALAKAVRFTLADPLLRDGSAATS